MVLATNLTKLVISVSLQSTRLTPSDIASGPDAHSDVTSMTSASGVSSLPDLQSFNTLLEQALTWLLDAKERFNKMSPVAEDVEEVKAQFHEHEVCESRKVFYRLPPNNCTRMYRGMSVFGYSWIAIFSILE